jgi:hypothetical protein
VKKKKAKKKSGEPRWKGEERCSREGGEGKNNVIPKGMTSNVNSKAFGYEHFPKNRTYKKTTAPPALLR